ncbi:ABC transporter ATP-binding protein [Streptomyces sp. NPDC126514]|uniref:ABC transporter ATP-binding protein n=1 Tax=Streptomyces sp. NPDC126514 TaxID=3155210 RepID=UPI003321C11A
MDQVGLRVEPGEILGLVGESGSGKTTLALAFLLHCRPGLRLSGGQVFVGGMDLTAASPKTVRQMRGRTIAYVPQSPAAALNPALCIGTQLRECIREPGSTAVLNHLLQDMRLPGSQEFLRRYPHQLSGGQQQRVVMAIALAQQPDFIVFDEPTSSLDVSTQGEVLKVIRHMCSSRRQAGVFVSHDIAVVADVAQRIAVMYAGRIIEEGPTASLLSTPLHPYTARLIMAMPDRGARREMTGIPGSAPAPHERPPGCSFAPRCLLADDQCRHVVPPVQGFGSQRLVRCFKPGAQQMQIVERKRTPVRQERARVLEVRSLSTGYGASQVLRHVNLALTAGECMAVVGESGSGKTTLCRSIVGLQPSWEGQVRLNGAVLAQASHRRSRGQRRQVQYIFQDPYESLNPCKSVRELILGPVKATMGRSGDPESTVLTALERVELPASVADRLPRELSGGERQRVAIARALAVQPIVLVCDEVTSSLDASVKSNIVTLLRGLQMDMGLALLFVTHDITLARYLAQSVTVLHDGRVVDQGTLAEALDGSAQPHTQSLVANAAGLQ